MGNNTESLAQGSDCSDLARFLGQSYQNFHGHRPVGSGNVPSIRIDDRGKRDISHDFCRMSVLIPDNATDRFTLYLANPPLNDEVAELIEGNDGKITGSHPEVEVEITFLVKEVLLLRRLAKAIRRVRRPRHGERYPVPNWWWVCPRTADSLDRLADRLIEYRRIRRYEPWSLRGASASGQVPASAKQNAGGRPAVAVNVAKSSHSEDEEDIFRLLGGE